MKWLLLLLLLSSCASRRVSVSPSTQTKPDFLHQLMADSFPGLHSTNGKDHHRIRIVYTQINRDEKGKPQFKDFRYNLDSSFYSYPASTVKLPTAILALEAIRNDPDSFPKKESPMITYATAAGEIPVFNDPTSPEGAPSIAHYIRKILLVSDNDAYNRLYEFVGQEAMNNRLHQLGYDSVQIVHRLEIFLTEEQNRRSNAIRFIDTASQKEAMIPARFSKLPYQKRSDFLGRGFMRAGKLVSEPFDFSMKNRLPLEDLHTMMKVLFYPEAFPKEKRFRINEDDLRFLYRYMSMLPVESVYPNYGKNYEEGYVKFLMLGGKGKMPDSIRIFNKVGDAYGFLTDAAYIVDFRNGVEFFLSATIYCNEDGILNDSKYDYESVGLPFLQKLGQLIYKHELGRKKKITPNLDHLKFNYTDWLE